MFKTFQVYQGEYDIMKDDYDMPLMTMKSLTRTIRY